MTLVMHIEFPMRSVACAQLRLLKRSFFEGKPWMAKSSSGGIGFPVA